MKQPLKIGVTGGLGSGKTLICKTFESLGIPVYDSDAAAKKLMNTDEEIISAIKKNFGEKIFHDGSLDRKMLATAVFNNNEKLGLLNNITHPAVRKDFLKWVAQQHTPYIIKEAAIMYESGANKDIDFMITVFAPKELRIQRALSRQNISREQIESRMSRQMSEEEKMKLADFTVINDGEQAVLPQILSLHELLLKKAAGEK